MTFTRTIKKGNLSEKNLQNIFCAKWKTRSWNKIFAWLEKRSNKAEENFCILKSLSNIFGGFFHFEKAEKN